MMSGTLKTVLASSILPNLTAQSVPAAPNWRVINIMNFIRAEEPREAMDLMEPVRGQMALIKEHGFSATWLLQYDALVEGPFVKFLKQEMPASHEIGIWFEMNRKICGDAGIPWRGKPDWEWDYHVPIAYAIGYTPDERRKLADTSMATFKRIFGHEAKSIASWNLDAITIAHLSDHYGIDAFGNCRDQLATDGFTIWGAPIAAYYPNRLNAWSPAVDTKNQIATPMFRLLGQDPVYYYDKAFSYPDTMEPAWPSGHSKTFVDNFVEMIARSPTQSIAYAQLGQENSFGWPVMKKAYAMQMHELATALSSGKVKVETMGETGRRFKRSFRSTPTQAQVMLEDPFGNVERPQRTVWYQSKYYRANLHFRGDEFYLRDLHVYNDAFPQPYLTEPVRQHGIEQRLLAVLDGYHWSDDEVRAGRTGRRAMGRFVVTQHGQEHQLAVTGLPEVSERQSGLQATITCKSGGKLIIHFEEKQISFRLIGSLPAAQLTVLFEWVDEQSAIHEVMHNKLHYRFRDFDYSIQVLQGNALRIQGGVRVTGEREGLSLKMVQS